VFSQHHFKDALLELGFGPPLWVYKFLKRWCPGLGFPRRFFSLGSTDTGGGTTPPGKGFSPENPRVWDYRNILRGDPPNRRSSETNTGLEKFSYKEGVLLFKHAPGGGKKTLLGALLV